MKWILVLMLVMFVSCTLPNRMLSYTVQTKPVYPIDPAANKILLLNSFDIKAKKFRDNKEELFIDFTDSLMNWTGRKILDKTNIPVQVLNGYTNANSNRDSAVYRYLNENEASHAIIVEWLDIYFVQTNVDVTKNADGSKDRKASYDIATDMELSFYATNELLKKLKLHKQYYHSSRTVVSGLLAAGPNIVSHKKDASKVMLMNANDYLNYFFPGEVQRNRTMFTGKGFEAVSAAIAKNDYETALIINMQLISDPKKQKAAKAAYNCAVLFERKSQLDESRKYLLQSQELYPLVPARVMLEDLGG